MAKTLSGSQRAVMLLMSLDEAHAAALLNNISDSALAKLRKAAEAIDVQQIGTQEKRDTLLSFLRSQQGGTFFLGNPGERFRRALVKAKGEQDVKRMYREQDEQDKKARGEPLVDEEQPTLTFLQNLPDEELAVVLERESPRCSAVLLSMLPGEKGGRLLSIVGAELREKIVERVIAMEDVSSDVMTEVLMQFEQELRKSKPGSRLLTEEERVADLATMIASLRREAQERILSVVRENNPELADKIEKRIFAFEELVKVTDRSLQQLLSQVEARVVAVAIKGAPQPIQDHILSNLSERVRDQVAEERELAGSVPVSRAVEAREEIMKVARQMEKDGQITFVAEREEEEYVE